MARQREFDTEETLEKAMRLFWQKGYSETSVRDLVKGTGVAHAGLYAAFGDKRGLFEAALERYAEFMLPLFDRLAAPGAGRQAIADFFATVASSAVEGRFRHGCMVANTSVEIGAGTASGDGRGAAVVRRVLDRQLMAFEAAARQARVDGDASPRLDPGRTAAGMVAIFYGVSALARAQAPHSAIHAASSAAVTLLDA
ncbi:MAG: helix-turn-helix domain-containing protein [Acidobacteriota bacterium]